MNWKFWKRTETISNVLGFSKIVEPENQYHLQFVREIPNKTDYFGNQVTIVVWRCATTGKTYEETDYGNRFNTTLGFSCPSCGKRFPGYHMEQDQWGHSREQVMRACGVDDEKDGLTESNRADLQSGKCPDCHGTEWYEGPSGGMAQNMYCANKKCGSRFNLALPFFMQRISDPMPRDRGEPRVTG